MTQACFKACSNIAFGYKALQAEYRIRVRIELRSTVASSIRNTSLFVKVMCFFADC